MKIWKKTNKKGFTLAEVITAVGIMVIIVSFASVIFQSSIEAYRMSGANAEIIQKLQTITTHLDRDLSQVRKDGLLIIRFHNVSKKEYENSPQTNNFRMDRIYYFTAGDFQSWYQDAVTGKLERSNTAGIFFGHDNLSLNDKNVPMSKCKLARDVMLLTPETAVIPPAAADWRKESFVSLVSFLSDANQRNTFISNIENSVAGAADANSMRQLMCENVGEVKIDWSYGEIDAAKKILIWLGGPGLWVPAQYIWPKALRFTFTLYDSKQIIKGGRTFTHIVYLGD